MLFTVALELLWIGWDIFPVAGSKEAIIVDDAFHLMTVLAIPVFTFVVTVIGYTLIKFRAQGDEVVDGPPVRTHSPWVKFWLLWTTALCVAVIIHPGYTGLMELRETNSERADLVVDVTGQQWIWLFDYPDSGISNSTELVLPVNKLVRFNISTPDSDVVHSFWVPAFRTKIDAVPGLTTNIDIVPTRIGDYNEDVNYRVQCAELCGLNHATMFARVRVVSEEDFNDWVAQRSGKASTTSTGGSSS